MMEEIDLPEYFLCPISLEIMKDPVITVTGITYDRLSIQQWLSTSAVCPVTKQPLPPTSDLTPNHMLRRLIQAWCVANAVDRIPTPKSPLHRSLVLKLIRDLNRRNADPSTQINSLNRMAELAAAAEEEGGEKNRRCMAEAGVPNAMLSFLTRSFNEGSKRVLGLEEALRILKLTWTPAAAVDNSDLGQCMLRVLKIAGIERSARANALVVLKNVIEVLSSGAAEKLLKLEHLEEMVKVLREEGMCEQGVRAALRVLTRACAWGRNRAAIAEAGAVFELIEMELSGGGANKKTTEMVMGLVAQLCGCAEGRQQLLKHSAGMAVVAKRLLRNTPATDDLALFVMEAVARFAATEEVVAEMLRIGAVAKLCVMLHADCADYLKKKAREILRLHPGEWTNSPCVPVIGQTLHEIGI